MIRYVVQCSCGAKTGTTKPVSSKESQFVDCCICGRSISRDNGSYLPELPADKEENEYDLLKLED